MSELKQNLNPFGPLGMAVSRLVFEIFLVDNNARLFHGNELIISILRSQLDGAPIFCADSVEMSASH